MAIRKPKRTAAKFTKTVRAARDRGDAKTSVVRSADGVRFAYTGTPLPRRTTNTGG